MEALSTTRGLKIRWRERELPKELKRWMKENGGERLCRQTAEEGSF